MNNKKKYLEYSAVMLGLHSGLYSLTEFALAQSMDIDNADAHELADKIGQKWTPRADTERMFKYILKCDSTTMALGIVSDTLRDEDSEFAWKPCIEYLVNVSPDDLCEKGQRLYSESMKWIESDYIGRLYGLLGVLSSETIDRMKSRAWLRLNERSAPEGLYEFVYDLGLHHELDHTHANKLLPLMKSENDAEYQLLTEWYAEAGGEIKALLMDSIARFDDGRSFLLSEIESICRSDSYLMTLTSIAGLTDNAEAVCYVQNLVSDNDPEIDKVSLVPCLVAACVRLKDRDFVDEGLYMDLAVNGYMASAVRMLSHLPHRMSIANVVKLSHLSAMEYRIQREVIGCFGNCDDALFALNYLLKVVEMGSMSERLLALGQLEALASRSEDIGCIVAQRLYFVTIGELTYMPHLDCVPAIARILSVLDEEDQEKMMYSLENQITDESYNYGRVEVLSYLYASINMTRAIDWFTGLETSGNKALRFILRGLSHVEKVDVCDYYMLTVIFDFCHEKDNKEGLGHLGQMLKNLTSVPEGMSDWVSPYLLGEEVDGPLLQVAGWHNLECIYELLNQKACEMSDLEFQTAVKSLMNGFYCNDEWNKNEQ